jgi:hypothetical protein
MRTTARATVLGAFAAALAVASPGPAEACGNAVVFVTDFTVRSVKLAEDKLNDGDPAAAALLVQHVIKKMTEVREVVRRPKPSSADLLVYRGLRVLALAAVRRDGELSPSGKTKPDDRRANLFWAVTILEGLAQLKDRDAATMTDYGEALAKVGRSTEAKLILEKLSQNDVLATPYAYAALAGLRAAAGDAHGQEAALAKCTLMAARKSICDVSIPRPGR